MIQECDNKFKGLGHENIGEIIWNGIFTDPKFSLDDAFNNLLLGQITPEEFRSASLDAIWFKYSEMLENKVYDIVESKGD